MPFYEGPSRKIHFSTPPLRLPSVSPHHPLVEQSGRPSGAPQTSSSVAKRAAQHNMRQAHIPCVHSPGTRTLRPYNTSHNRQHGCIRRENFSKGGGGEECLIAPHSPRALVNTSLTNAAHPYYRQRRGSPLSIKKASPFLCKAATKMFLPKQRNGHPVAVDQCRMTSFLQHSLLPLFCASPT